ncbi:GAS2-like protein pickled eggs [Schistocerca piceifrons]|uniref:GAS2-like protein pickled eggs n=1 Tax=Schistocerca piceifrons TaxID=274613 RepID=UPI001F5FE642|nr:GAS2-like protein pickled eggs [Schistocerca piceifrons]
MEVTPVLRDSRSLRPFKSSEEYLYAMKEDLAEWLQTLYPELCISVHNFMDRLDTGVALCKHANNVRTAAEEYMARRLARRSASSANLMSASLSATGSIARPVIEAGPVHFLPAAQPGTFFARDNVSNFIRWCRHALGVFECLLFETDDLILRKNERNVILCLLDVARRGAKFGMAAPMLVRFEREIDREMAAEQRALQRASSVATESADSDDDDDDFDAPVGPVPQIVTNDLKSLDEMVRDLVERCSCPVQFPMIRVSEGKYRIGDTKVLIFVRVLRSHVMVRVGGGWDTLSHYLDKHDPCRCKTAHRSPLSAKLILKQTGAIELNNALVHYERSPPRTRRSSASSVGSGGPPSAAVPTPPPPPPQPQPLSPGGGGGTGLRSRSPTPRRSLAAPRPAAGRSRSRSPTPGGAKPHALAPGAGAGGGSGPQRSRDASPGKPLQRKDRDPSPAVAPAPASAPAPAPASTAADAHNDSGSEVSDEGYRSLGTVAAASSPPAQGVDDGVVGVKAVAEDSEVAADECKDGGVAADAQASERQELSRHASSPDSVVSTSEEAATPRQQDACSSASSDRDSRDQLPEVTLSPRRMASLQVKPQSQYRRPSQQESPQQQQQPQQQAAAPMTRSRSTCGAVECGFSDAPAELFAPAASRRQQQQSGSKGRAAPSAHPSSYNTWSGRQGRAAPKSRPPLTDNTFSRSSVQRRSLGAYGGGRPHHSNNNYQHASAPCSPRRQPPPAAAAAGGGKGSLPASLSGSPTKISPLIEQVLSVKELDNDVTVLNKMRQIIRQYADLVGDAADADADAGAARPPSEELDLTSAWVHGNGSLPRRAASVCGGDLGAAVGPSPRKDSKGSRIPAPLPLQLPLPLVSYGSRQLDS